MTENLIYLDTFVFMDILSGNNELSKKAQSYIKNNKSIVSSIVLTELGFHVAKKKRSKMDEVMFYVQSMDNIEIVDVTKEIAMLAARLRTKYRKKISKNLTYFDCIHLATALQKGCKKFVTGDKDFKEIKEIEMDIY